MAAVSKSFGGPQMQAGDWISDSTRPQAKAALPNKIVHDPLRKTVPGKYAAQLKSILDRSSFSAFRIEELNEYPDLEAARLVGVGSYGVSVSLVLQKLTRRINLEDITMGSPLDKLERLTDGSQLVLVNRLMPQESQVVITRKEGFMLTATVTMPPVATGASPLVAVVAPDLPSPEQLGGELAVAFKIVV